MSGSTRPRSSAAVGVIVAGFDVAACGGHGEAVSMKSGCGNGVKASTMPLAGQAVLDAADVGFDEADVDVSALDPQATDDFFDDPKPTEPIALSFCSDEQFLTTDYVFQKLEPEHDDRRFVAWVFPSPSSSPDFDRISRVFESRTESDAHTAELDNDESNVRSAADVVDRSLAVAGFTSFYGRDSAMPIGSTGLDSDALDADTDLAERFGPILSERYRTAYLAGEAAR